MKKDESAKTNPQRDKSFRLAVRMVRLNKFLPEERKAFNLSNQLLRAGTNPAAMAREAVNAESPMDFIHKPGVAQKEVAETQFWL